MITISRKSWHYRYCNWMHLKWKFRALPEPRDLCSYCRTTSFWILFFPPCLLILAPVMLVIFLVACSLTFVNWITDNWSKEEKQHSVTKTTTKSPKPKQPSLMVEWLKAKKEKACPLIEWKD